MASKKAKPTRHGKTQFFEYVTDAGTIRIPYIENIPSGIIEDAMNVPQSQVIGFILAALLDEDQNETRRAMTRWELNDMLAKWQDESVMSLGE